MNQNREDQREGDGSKGAEECNGADREGLPVGSGSQLKEKTNLSNKQLRSEYERVRHPRAAKGL